MLVLYIDGQGVRTMTLRFNVCRLIRIHSYISIPLEILLPKSYFIQNHQCFISNLVDVYE